MEINVKVNRWNSHSAWACVDIFKHTGCLCECGLVCMINNNQEDSSRAGFMLSFERSTTHTHTHATAICSICYIYIHNVALCSSSCCSVALRLSDRNKERENSKERESVVGGVRVICICIESVAYFLAPAAFTAIVITFGACKLTNFVCSS